MEADDGLMRGVHWLEPLLPGEGRYPPSLLASAEQLPFLAGKLSSVLPPATTERLGRLLRVTNTYYTNLIEGQHTEPATLAEGSRRKSAKELKQLSVEHMHAQSGLEALILQRKAEIRWPDMFSPELVERVHERLFKNAGEDERQLEDGSFLQPGQMRSECGRIIRVGGHTAPAPDSVRAMMIRMKDRYGHATDQRTRIVCAMAYHHRMAFVHPFADGNGRVVRMLTHLQLHYLGMSAPLWSLSRGLAKRQDEYYQRLSSADKPRRGDLDGRGQLSEKALCEFIEFMLDVCLDQMKYMEEMISVHTLRNRIEVALKAAPQFQQAGIKQECARALHILLTQGEVTRSDFKVYTGLGLRTATEQLSRLNDLKLIDAPSQKSRQIYPGLPIWFADWIFPDLHRRFRPT